MSRNSVSDLESKAQLFLKSTGIPDLWLNLKHLSTWETQLIFKIELWVWGSSQSATKLDLPFSISFGECYQVPTEVSRYFVLANSSLCVQFFIVSPITLILMVKSHLFEIEDSNIKSKVISRKSNWIFSRDECKNILRCIRKPKLIVKYEVESCENVSATTK